MNSTLSNTGKNDGIDALRGIAALLVVLFHMNQVGFGITGLAWTQIGLLGVNLFFTLSGFLIARCVMAPTVFDGRKYLTSRSRRILPNYFIAMLLVISLADVRSLIHVSLGHALGDLFTHALLIHGWFPDFSTSIMGPFWTLSHEWMFYLLMLGAAPLLRSGKWWLVPLTMALAAFSVRFGHAQKWWDLPGELTHPIALWDQFAAGIIAAGLTLRSPENSPKPWLRPLLIVLGTAVVAWSVWKLLGLSLEIDPTKHKGGAFGEKVMEKFYARRSNVLWFSPVLAAGIAMALAGIWMGTGTRWKFRLLPWMGHISYSTYLYHMPVVICFMRAFKNLPAESFAQNPTVVFFIVITMVYGFSVFAFHFFEKPWMGARKASVPAPLN